MLLQLFVDQLDLIIKWPLIHSHRNIQSDFKGPHTEKVNFSEVEKQSNFIGPQTHKHSQSDFIRIQKHSVKFYWVKDTETITIWFHGSHRNMVKFCLVTDTETKSKVTGQVKNNNNNNNNTNTHTHKRKSRLNFLGLWILKYSVRFHWITDTVTLTVRPYWVKETVFKIS